MRFKLKRAGKIILDYFTVVQILTERSSHFVLHGFKCKILQDLQDLQIIKSLLHFIVLDLNQYIKIV